MAEPTTTPLTRRIADIQIGPRHRRAFGDLAALAASIADVGLLHPVVIRPDGLLIAGHRRLLACQQLGMADIPVHVVALEEIVRGECAENGMRKDFAPSEWVAITRAVEDQEQAAARQRQREGGKRGGEASGKLPEASTARDALARYVGISGRTLERAQAVVAAAEAAPERYAPLVDEMDDTGRVNGVYKKLVVQRQAEAIAAEPPPLPSGPYRVIVADPPWSYDARPEDVSHRAANPYRSMATEDIRALPVGPLAADDAVLWLWTTNAHLPEAFGVVTAWGFAYKTLLTWVKPRLGLGDYLRGRTEHCLLAVRGRPTRTLTTQSTVLEAPAGEHSEKPDAFFELVESLCPGSRLELFARRPRPGWVAWGHELAASAPPAAPAP